MYKFAFLDRDGVINIDKSYLYKISDFVFLNGIFNFCKLLKKLDYKIAIITNQSGIARGLYSEDDYQKLTRWMEKEFLKRSIYIDHIIHCPFHPEAKIGKYRKNSDLRKPKTGMIEKIDHLSKIDRRESFIVGDKKTDILCGYKAGLKFGIFVNKNKFSGRDSLQDFHVYEVNSLSNASKIIKEINDYK